MPHPHEHPWVLHLSGRLRSEAPPVPCPDGPPRGPRRLEVFATGPDWVQLTWSALGPGTITVDCTGRRSEIRADGGPGAHLVEHLPDDRDITIELRGPGLSTPTSLRARTLRTPPGAELLRIATISDVHVGSRSTGYLHTIVEVPEPDELHPVRCLRAAVGELAGWGAEHLVVKGDLVDRSHRTHWDTVGEVLGGLDIPVDVLPGNHERSTRGDVDPSDAARSVGLHLVHGVEVVDRDGVRIVMADTTQPGTDWGSVATVADHLLDAVDVDRPVFVGLHHQPMRFRLPTYLPPGLPGPAARSLLRALGEVNPRVLVSSGHTHRHRRHHIGNVTATEVGSTKDFPGTWAGYQVFEGGIVQTVRRVSEPSCIRWTDFTRRAAGGAWSWWAPGPLSSRCFSITW